MTERSYIEAMREEGINIEDLQDLPYKERFTNGFAINTESAYDVMVEIRSAGKDYRMQMYVTTIDENRYPVFINRGRDNGIGPDGLADKMDREELSIPEAVEFYTEGLVREEDIAFYQLNFEEERHRSK